MEIEVIEKSVTDYRKVYYIELKINNKIIEISIQEDYNFNGDYTSTDWDLITDIELEDEEHDLLSDWVSRYEYEKVKK